MSVVHAAVINEEEIGRGFTSTRSATMPSEKAKAESAVAPIPASFEDKVVSDQNLLREVEARLSSHRDELQCQLSEDSWRHRSELVSHHDELYDQLVGCLLTSRDEFEQHLSHLDGHCQDLDVRLTDTTSHLDGISTLVESHPSAGDFSELADAIAGKMGKEDLRHMETGLAEQRAALDAQMEELQTRTAEATRRLEQLTTDSLGFASATQFHELSETVRGKAAVESLSELANAVAVTASAEHLARLDTGLSEQAAGLENVRNELSAEISKVAAASLAELANVIAGKASTEHLGRLEAGLAKQVAGLENVRNELHAEISKVFAQHQSALDAHREEVRIHDADAVRQRKELSGSLQGLVPFWQFQELTEIVQSKVDVAEYRDLARAVESKASFESVSKLAEDAAAKGTSGQFSDLDARLQVMQRLVSTEDVRHEEWRTRVDEMSRQHARSTKDLEARLAVLDLHGQESDARLLQCSAQLEVLDASLETKVSAGELENLSDASGRACLEVRELRTLLDQLQDQILQTSGQHRSSMDVLREEQHGRIDELARKHEQLSNIMRSMTREFDQLVGTVGTKASKGDLSARLRAHSTKTTREPAPEIEISLPPEPPGRRGACCGFGAAEDDAESVSSKDQQSTLFNGNSVKHIMAGGPKTFSIKPGVPRPCSVPRKLC